jgi:exonuclease SbcD
MKILHTADWHLGKWLGSISRLPEQKEVLEELCSIVEQENPDIVLIAGDIYDQINPPVEAVYLLHQTLMKMSANGKRAIVIIAGNHDSPERIEAIEPLLFQSGIIVAGWPFSAPMCYSIPSGISIISSAQGFVELQLPHCKYPVKVLLGAYANTVRCTPLLSPDNQDIQGILKKLWNNTHSLYQNKEGFNLFIGHGLFMGSTIPEEDEGERSVMVGGAQAIPLSYIPENIDYAALGHIHKPLKFDSASFPILYSGSPLCYSMAEAGQKKHIVMAEFVSPGQSAVLRYIELSKGKSLIKIYANSVQDALQSLSTCQNSYVELHLILSNHITIEEKNKLYDAHDGIVDILLKMDMSNAVLESMPDMTISISELFKSFYKEKKGIDPSNEMMQLFNEVLNSTNNHIELYSGENNNEA